MLRALAGTGKRIVIDQGAGTEETGRVQRSMRTCGRVESWSGAYAPFASAISKAKHYVGYDSAGQHVAAACGTPLVSIFTGYTSRRMFQRWRPYGPGRIDVVKVEPDSRAERS